MRKQKEVKVGTTRRVVRERCLPPAHAQPDGPAVRPYLLHTPEKPDRGNRRSREPWNKSILHFLHFSSSAFPQLSALIGILFDQVKNVSMRIRPAA